MKAAVRKIAEQVKALPESELDEFLSWLAEYGAGRSMHGTRRSSGTPKKEEP